MTLGGRTMCALGVSYYCGSVFEGHKQYQRGYEQAIKAVEPHLEKPTTPTSIKSAPHILYHHPEHR